MFGNKSDTSTDTEKLLYTEIEKSEITFTCSTYFIQGGQNFPLKTEKDSRLKITKLIFMQFSLFILEFWGHI